MPDRSISAGFAPDRRHRVLAGVCADIGEAIDVHPDLVRILAVMLALVSGPLALIAYLFAALVARRA